MSAAYSTPRVYRYGDRRLLPAPNRQRTRKDKQINMHARNSKIKRENRTGKHIWKPIKA
jgi:hypothetical protein